MTNEEIKQLRIDLPNLLEHEFIRVVEAVNRIDKRRAEEEIRRVEKHSNYIDMLVKQDDEEMDHMIWSLKRFAKKDDPLRKAKKEVVENSYHLTGNINENESQSTRDSN